MAGMMYGLQPGGIDEDLYGDAAAYAAAAAAGLNSADESLPYSTSELNAPEYSTDDFRMFQFKVARCSKRYVHDWRACPFAHPTENARRRDPRSVQYLPIPCPDYKRGICLRGDSCTYSHGVYECWLHPNKYRTQLCKEGPNCRRPVCFFAHSVLDLRQPSHSNDRHHHHHHFQAGPAAPEANVAAVLAAQAAQQQQQAAQAAAVQAARRASADVSSFQRLSSEEILNNLQDGRSSVDGASLGHLSTGQLSAAAALAGSPASTMARTGSGPTRTGSNGSQGSGSPERSRSGSPPSPVQLLGAGGGVGSLTSSPAVGGMSDAASAMAVLQAQQQAQAQAQAQVQAQAAAALARMSMDAQTRLSMDAQAQAARGSMDAAAARASLDAATAAATTQAMLAGGRMSLDSLLASRQAQAGGWAPGAVPPQGATAAAALAAGNAALPVNEQAFPAGNVPRMSNAVARKLGLAPQRSSLDARLTKLRGGPVASPAGMATPARGTSLDGILHALQQAGSARSSLDQQAAMLQAMQAQQQLAAAGLAHGQGGMPGAGYPGASNNGYGGQGGAGYGSQPAPDAASLHPALLSLVAAQMQGNGNGGAPAGPARGVPSGMHSGLGAQHGSDANMAALVESLNGWQLNGGGAGMDHRASMEGMSGMAGAPAQGMQGGAPAGGPYYDGGQKGIWGSQEAINNQAGAES